MNLCLVALGANLPSGAAEPAETLESAVILLPQYGFRPLARSRWWRTPAHPPGAGPDFVNGAIACESPLDAEAALAALHAIERRLGRERPSRWAPRVCDLDLIAWNDAIRPDRDALDRWMALDDAAAREATPDRLILPHPRMQDRAFVLAPLAEIAPDWRHPATGRSVAEMLAALAPASRAGMAPLS